MLKKLFKLSIFIIILAAISFGGYKYWLYQKQYPSTDDAYIQSHVVEIAPRVAGAVANINTSDHQFVKKGQLLFTLDPANFQVAVNKAKAQIDNVYQTIKAQQMAVITAAAVVKQHQAELQEAKNNAERVMVLVKQKLYTPSQGDQAIRQLKVAQQAVKASQAQFLEAKQKLGQQGDKNAQLREAKANLEEAILNLNYTKIYAPSDGYVENFSLRTGDKVSAFETIFALVENKNWWVSANFKETQIQSLQPRQPATIVVDMYPSHTFHGTVTSVGWGSGTSFSLLPPENASGNWVKVTQRFPVKISINDLDPKQFPLRLGSSCSVTVNTISDSSK